MLRGDVNVPRDNVSRVAQANSTVRLESRIGSWCRQWRSLKHGCGEGWNQFACNVLGDGLGLVAVAVLSAPMAESVPEMSAEPAWRPTECFRTSCGTTESFRAATVTPHLDDFVFEDFHLLGG